jgi:hypothetical protein
MKIWLTNSTLIGDMEEVDVNLNPWSVYDMNTHEVIDQSASKERAHNRLWEIKKENDKYKNHLLAVSQKFKWNCQTK